MTRTTDQRELTAADVEALPASSLRDVLIASFNVERHASHTGLQEQQGVLIQYLRVPARPGATTVPGLISDPEQRPLHGVLDHLADQLESNINLWDHVIHPDSAGATLLGLGVVHEGWVLPTSAAEDADRDPGDVPGALACVLLKGLTVDGAGFVVFRRPGQPPVARIELVTDSGTHTTGRVDLLQQALKRNVAVFHAAYAHAALDHPTHSPPAPTTAPDPHPPSAGHADDTPADTPGGDPAARPAQSPASGDSAGQAQYGLSLGQVEQLPPSPLADLVLHAVRIEGEHQRMGTLGATPCIAVCHHLHEDHELSHTEVVVLGELGLAQGLSELAADIHTDSHVRAALGWGPGVYAGVSIITDSASAAASSAAVAPALAERRRAARLIVGMAPEGGYFLVQRDHGHLPEISIVHSRDEAESAFGRDVVHSLHTLDHAFRQLGAAPDTTHNSEDSATSDTDTLPDPNADLADLPPEVATANRTYVLVRSQRHPDDPPEGNVYPPIPADHPLATRLCLCRAPLADGQPVQTYAVAPLGIAAMRALADGRAHESVSVLGHQRCILRFGTTVAHALSTLFGTWGLNHG